MDERGKENASDEKRIYPADKHVMSVNHVTENGDRTHVTIITR